MVVKEREREERGQNALGRKQESKREGNEEGKKRNVSVVFRETEGGRVEEERRQGMKGERKVGGGESSATRGSWKGRAPGGGKV